MDSSILLLFSESLNTFRRKENFWDFEVLGDLGFFDFQDFSFSRDRNTVNL